MENLEKYYRTINQINEQIQKWEEEKKKASESIKRKIFPFLDSVFTVLLVFSLIPIFPSLLVYIGDLLNWEFWQFAFNNASVGNYAITWIICVILFILLLILSNFLDKQINPPEVEYKSKSLPNLSPEQLSFLLIHQAYQELSTYFINPFDQYLEKAQSLLKKMDRINQNPLYRGEHFGPSKYYQTEKDGYYKMVISYKDYKRNNYSISKQAAVAEEFFQTFEKYDWFSLDKLTKSRLQALITYKYKTQIRLKKRIDLPSVLLILENLSKYLYAYLPEHKVRMNNEEMTALHNEGKKYLDLFSQEVNKLVDIKNESKKVFVKRNAVTDLSKKTHKSLLNNVGVRFLFWLLIILVITSGIFLAANIYFPELDISIVVSTIIAASVAGAATISQFINHGKEIDSTVKNLPKNENIKT